MEGKLIAYHLRYTIRATETLELEQHPGSALRGSLFQALLKRFCVNQDAPECASCPLVQTCPVSALVAPLRDEFPRGRDVPRPFVVRPPLITASGLETTGLRLESGQQVTFGLTLFGKAGKLFPYVVLAAQMMEQNGLGRPLREHRWRRGRFALERIEALHPFTGEQVTLFERSKPQVRSPELAITAEDVAARAAALSSERISLHFLTPTRLTEHGALVHQPEPGALVRRLAERLDMLEQAYAPVQAQQPAGDVPRVAGRWRAVEEAADLQMTGSDTRWVDTKSYSSRQQRALPIGGFVGTLTFTGALTPSLRELLVWGEIVHVGKNCVKGDGWYQIEA